MNGPTAARLGLLALFWGSSFLLIKVALEGLSPMQIVLARLTGGAAVLGAIVLLSGRSLPRGLRVWGHLAAAGAIGNILPFFLFAWGEQRVTSGLAGILNGTTPLFTLALAIAFLPEERLRGGRALGLALGFLGVVVVVGPWDPHQLTSSVPGQLACLMAAASYGVAFVYTRRFLAGRDHPPMVLAAGQLLVAAAQMWLLAPFAARGPVSLEPAVVGAVLLLGAVGTGLAYLLFYRIITDAGATTASMVSYLLPVVAVVLGIVVLGEPVTWNLFAGAAVVIAGVAVAEGRIRGRRGRPLPPHESGAPPPAADMAR